MNKKHNNVTSREDKWWDYYSDQPYILSKHEKPRTDLASITDSAKTLATTIAYAPALGYKYYQALKQPAVAVPNSNALKDFVGLGVQPSHEHNNAVVDMVEELGVKHLLLRVPAWQESNFEALRSFIDSFDKPSNQVSAQNKTPEFIINILQSPEMVNNPRLWRKNITEIFTIFGDKVNIFQICNASNRSKWGCRHITDYLMLHEIAEQIRNEHFNHLKLLGASIIDFEPLVSIRSLINQRKVQYDGCALALYVNRRLSPYNKQFKHFDLDKKIRLAYATWQLSNRKSSQAQQAPFDKLWITETNWPLLNTKPYTPNSGNPRSTVDEATQAQFLTEYINIAFQTNMVERVYWWQLINPGYGLVDHRQFSSSQHLRKMPSFYALKNLLQNNES